MRISEADYRQHSARRLHSPEISLIESQTIQQEIDD
jgi:hypothetical protein